MGVHHLTAVAGDPQRNLDFYAGVLGLRLVKLTVNFDDPSTYHFYFGDELGRPGSILTFFPWPEGQPGRHGTGQVGTVSLAIPPVSLGYWLGRLLAQGVKYVGPNRRFDERVLEFRDPDGLLLELVATPRVGSVEPWTDGPVSAEHAIRGLHGATIGKMETAARRTCSRNTWALQRRGGKRIESVSRRAIQVLEP